MLFLQNIIRAMHVVSLIFWPIYPALVNSTNIQVFVLMPAVDIWLFGATRAKKEGIFEKRSHFHSVHLQPMVSAPPVEGNSLG